MIEQKTATAPDVQRAEPTPSTGKDDPATQSIRFLSAIFLPGDCVMLRPIETWTEDGKKRSRVDYRATQHRTLGTRNSKGVWRPWPEGLVRFLEAVKRRAAERHTNVLFGTCPRLGSGGQYGQAWQIRVVRTLWVDVDDCGVAEALERCKKAGLPKPSIVVNSGNGAHLYWLLSEPYLVDDVDAPPAVRTEFTDQGEGKKKKARKYIKGPDGEKLYLDLPANRQELSPKAIRAQDVLAGIAAAVDGDHTQDLSRMLRVPGTMNRKNERSGAKPVPCELVECDPQRRYPFSEFEKFADTSPARKEREKIAKVKLPTVRKPSAGKLDKFNRLILACDTADDGTRSEADWALVKFAIEKGLDRAEVWQHVRSIGKFIEGGRRYFDQTWDKAAQHTRQKIYTQVSRNGASKDGATAKVNTTTPAGNRPAITIDVDEMRVNDEAVAALAKVDGVYQRAGMLVHVTRGSKPPRGLTRPQGAPTIGIMPIPTLREKLASAAAWMKPKSEGEVQPASPPDWSVRAVHARGYWNEIPHLENVVETPTLRSDGTILDKPGYDESSGLLYQPNSKFPPIPNQPTQADAKEALAALRDVVVDFPFAEESYEAAWMAGLLGPLARHAIAGPIPAVAIDANTTGAGKTKLADCISAIATGRPIARSSAPGTDDEARKLITATALDGTPLVLIDNIVGAFGSASFDAAFTGTSWRDRILGESRVTRDLPLITCWFLTGNNPVYKGDIHRRILHIRLESHVEYPEKRTDFKRKKLMGWLHQERGRLAVAALTVLRAYCAAGRPDVDLEPWGSFEEWSALIRGAIVWAGMPDPAKTRANLTEQADRDRNVLQLLLEGLQEADPTGSGLTTAAIIEIANERDHRPEALHNAIEELTTAPGGKITTRSLGMKLNHLRQRVVGGRYLDKKPRTRGVWWLVCSVEKCRTSRTNRTNLLTPWEKINSLSNREENICGPGGKEISPVSPTSPVATTGGSLCTDHTWVDVPAGDDRVKVECSKCGKLYGYRRPETQQQKD